MYLSISQYLDHTLDKADFVTLGDYGDELY